MKSVVGKRPISSGRVPHKRTHQSNKGKGKARKSLNINTKAFAINDCHYYLMLSRNIFHLRIIYGVKFTDNKALLLIIITAADSEEHMADEGTDHHCHASSHSSPELYLPQANVRRGLTRNAEVFLSTLHYQSFGPKCFYRD